MTLSNTDHFFFWWMDGFGVGCWCHRKNREREVVCVRICLGYWHQSEMMLCLHCLLTGDGRRLGSHFRHLRSSDVLGAHTIILVDQVCVSYMFINSILYHMLPGTSHTFSNTPWRSTLMNSSCYEWHVSNGVRLYSYSSTCHGYLNSKCKTMHTVQVVLVSYCRRTMHVYLHICCSTVVRWFLGITTSTWNYPETTRILAEVKKTQR